MLQRLFAIAGFGILGLFAGACGEVAAPQQPPVEIECDREVPYPDCFIDRLWIRSVDDAADFCESPCARIRQVGVTSASGLKNLTFLRGVTELDFLSVDTSPDLESLDGAEVLGPEASAITLEGLPSLRSIEALRNVETVTRGLALRELPSLSSLHGLRNFKGLSSTAIAPLEFYGIGGITDLSGLEKIEEMEQGIVLQQNPKLTSLRGLHNARRLGALALVNLDAMRDIEGLDSLRYLGGMGINENDELRSLEGLSQVETIEGLTVIGNRRLPQCEVDALAARAVPPGEEVRSAGNDSSASCD